MVVYISKKDETVKATMDPAYVREEEGTVILDYITGPKAGKNVCISIATLKRWWRKSDEEVEVVEPEKDPTDEPLALLGGGDSAEIVEKEDKKVRVIDEIHLSNGQVLRVDVTDVEKAVKKDSSWEVRVRLAESYLLVEHPSTPGEYAIKTKEGKGLGCIRIGKKSISSYEKGKTVKFDYGDNWELAVESFISHLSNK